MVTNYLQEQGVNAILLPALEFMRTDKNSEPDPVYIKEKLAAQLEIHPDAEIYITQGFICRNAYGEIDNLQRGGSDYTASLIGAAVNASEIQIWTDIDGMHDNDPRIVDKTSPVRHLHFEEAAELAYFGAKILHPTCVQPAKYANIPVRLLNTMEPTAPGTFGFPMIRKKAKSSSCSQRQHHCHQDQIKPYVTGPRLLAQSIRNLRKLSDLYRHDLYFRGRCFRIH